MTVLAKNKRRLSKLVYNNIDNLFASAETLAKRGRYGAATHLMLSAREECVKWLLLHCWDHIDEGIKRKVYRHDFKHEAVIVFYTLIGQLGVLEFSELAALKLKKRNVQIATTMQLMNFAASEIFSVTNPQRLGQRINDIFVSGEKEIHENEMIEVLGGDEAERQGSIYVDFDSSLKETGGPHRFKKSDYERYKRDVRLARYYVDRCAGLNPNIRIIYRLFPTFRPMIMQLLRSYFVRVDKRHRAVKAITLAVKGRKTESR